MKQLVISSGKNPCIWIKKEKAENEDVFEEGTSTYRIFSRSFCNFVFPADIERPLPMKKKKDGQVNIKNVDKNEYYN